jgi:hypothetical protein
VRWVDRATADRDGEAICPNWRRAQAQPPRPLDPAPLRARVMGFGNRVLNSCGRISVPWLDPKHDRAHRCSAPNGSVHPVRAVHDEKSSVVFDEQNWKVSGPSGVIAIVQRDQTLQPVCVPRFEPRAQVLLPDIGSILAIVSAGLQLLAEKPVQRLLSSAETLVVPGLQQGPGLSK